MPPLSSEDASSPLPPYTEQHFDQQDLPRPVVQNEKRALASRYGVSPYQAAPHVDVEVPRGSPNSESEDDLRPPLPPKPKELLYSGGDLPSQSGEVSPFADPKSEPNNVGSSSGTSQESQSLALNALHFESEVSMAPASNIGSIERKEGKSGTRPLYGSEEDAYDGIY